MVDRLRVDCLLCFFAFPLVRELCGAGECCEAPPCLCGTAVGRVGGGGLRERVGEVKRSVARVDSGGGG